MRLYPQIWCLNMRDHLKFAYEVLRQTIPIQIAMNLTMRNETKVCIAKLSYEIWALLKYYTAYSSNSLPMFWKNLLVPSSSNKKSKRDQSNNEVNWNNLLCWDFVQQLIFLTSMTFQKSALFPVSGKKAPNLVDPLNWAILNHCSPQASNLLRYAPENKSTPWIVTEKRLL